MTIVGIAWHGSDADMQDFVQRHGITFANMIDDDGDLFARFQVPVQPAWVFVDADGTADTSLGAMNEEVLGQALSDLAGAG